MSAPQLFANFTMNQGGSSNGLMFATSAAMNIPGGSEGGVSAIPQPIEINGQYPAGSGRQGLVFQPLRFRRELLAHSQGMGGVLWGSVTIGSWLKDEVMMMGQHGLSGNRAPLILLVMGKDPHGMLLLPPANPLHYLPNLEADYCRDYFCCGNNLPTLHDLLKHYEEQHILPLPPVETPRAMRPMHNIMEVVLTNEVFLGNEHQRQMQQHPHHPLQLAPGYSPLHNLQYPQQPQQQMQQQQLHYGQIPPHQLPLSQPDLSDASMMDAGPLDQFPFPADGMGGEFGIPMQQQQQGNYTQHPPPGVTAAQYVAQRAVTPQGGALPRSNMAQGTEDEDTEMCIDDPARHLYVMEHKEHRPFLCPVVGCDKNYKNQNGLKYHRLHGHQGQILHANGDGTFLVIDPELGLPYPDGFGMERDKPYRCEVCGKRYKNMNGLKYHRAHTTH